MLDGAIQTLKELAGKSSFIVGRESAYGIKASDLKGKKKRKPWSVNARAAQAERIRAVRAKKKWSSKPKVHKVAPGVSGRDEE